MKWIKQKGNNNIFKSKHSIQSKQMKIVSDDKVNVKNENSLQMATLN